MADKPDKPENDAEVSAPAADSGAISASGGAVRSGDWVEARVSLAAESEAAAS